MSGATCATCRHCLLTINDDEDTIGYGEPRDIGICRRLPTHTRVEIVRHVCGEHAPTPAVGVPGLPELPQGWEWAGDDYTEARCAAFGLRVMVRGRTGYEVVSIVGNVRADVVEMTIARHRARAGGVS